MKQALPWMAISITLGAGGQVLLKMAAERLGGNVFGHLPLGETLLRLTQSPFIWIGLVLFGTSMVIWIRALVTAPLGLAYPIVSAGYVIVVLLSWIFFSEPIDLRQLAGMAAVVLGVILLGGS